MKSRSARLAHLKILLGLVLAASACRGLPKDQVHFSKGLSAYRDGDYETALLYLKPLVEQGNTASELLLAKMFQNGQGVPEDLGKADLLRNLAAAKLKDLVPQWAGSDAGNFKSISDQLSQWTGDAIPAAGGEGQDPAEALKSLDLSSIAHLGELGLEDEVANTENHAESPDTSPDSTAPPPAPATTYISPRPTRNSDQISLGLLRHQADVGDALAIRMLATAYERGYYGLSRDPEEAQRWRKKSDTTRLTATDDSDPFQAIPYKPLLAVAGLGLFFIGLAIWHFTLIKKKKRRRHARH